MALDKIHPLSYSALIENCEKKGSTIDFENAYTAYTKPDNKDFIYVEKKVEDKTLEDFDWDMDQFEVYSREQKTDLKRISEGYKFHIAIDDSKPDNNLEKAWDIVKDVLISHGVDTFKVVKQGSREKLSRDALQSGKEITIYAFKEARTPEQWQAIFQEITRALSANGIRPGSLPSSDNAIPGTHYISYRSDKYEPNDPYKNVVITSPNNQPKRLDKTISPLKVEDMTPEEIERQTHYQRPRR